MANKSNYRNKPVDPNQTNQVTPTTLAAGGVLDNSGVINVTAGEGYIKVSAKESVFVEWSTQDIDHLRIEGDYFADFAIAINIKGEVEYVKVDSIRDTLDPSMYLQIGHGFYDSDFVDFLGVFDVSFVCNGVVGMDTASDLKYTLEALPSISNLKLRPSTTEPMRLNVYVGEFEESASLDYGSNTRKAMLERETKDKVSSNFQEKLHRPEVELGDITQLYVRRLGDTRRRSGDYRYARLSYPEGVPTGSIRPIAFETPMSNAPSVPIPEGKWILIAMDVKKADPETTTEEQDTSFVAHYDPRTFSSKQEAYHAIPLTDKKLRWHRLGWVLVRSDCTDLSDTTTAAVLSSDPFGLVPISPPFISDEELAGLLEPYYEKLSTVETVEIDRKIGTFNASSNRWGTWTGHNTINQPAGEVRTHPSSYDTLTFHHADKEAIVSVLEVHSSTSQPSYRIRYNTPTGTKEMTVAVKNGINRVVVDEPLNWVSISTGGGSGNTFVSYIKPYIKSVDAETQRVRLATDGTMTTLTGEPFTLPLWGRILEQETKAEEFDVDTILVDSITGEVLTDTITGNVLVNA